MSDQAPRPMQRVGQRYYEWCCYCGTPGGDLILEVTTEGPRKGNRILAHMKCVELQGR